MKKKDLKTGMQIDIQGTRFVVLLGTKKGDVYVQVAGNRWGGLEYLREDLTHIHGTGDVNKVYECNCPDQYLVERFRDYALIWEREDLAKEMTIQEIQDELGYEIKIVEK